MMVLQGLLKPADDDEGLRDRSKDIFERKKGVFSLIVVDGAARGVERGEGGRGGRAARQPRRSQEEVRSRAGL